jgi:hypothetical protein
MHGYDGAKKVNGVKRHLLVEQHHDAAPASKGSRKLNGLVIP